jgi:peptidoglycan/xylan/chitin deacetylase (PgdA/CDA1 family)
MYKIVCDIEHGHSRDTTGTKDTQDNKNANDAKDIFDESAESIETEIEIEPVKKSEKKFIALTFDDGPHPQYTGEILEILSEKKVPATFFIVGSRAELHPELLKRMQKIDCEIGNHTYDHANLTKISNGEFLRQMDKCSEAIYKITGEYPVIYRPPFGIISRSNEKLLEEKMSKILWTVDSADWRTQNKDRVVTNVLKTVNNKSVILMHDFYSQTVAALPEIIDKLKEQGYEFVTVSELDKISGLPENLEYFTD